MQQIPVEDYLNNSLILKPEEVVIRDRLLSWLPDNIIDCHAHCNLPAHVSELEADVYWHMMSTFPSFSLEQSYEVQKVFYPGKNVRTLRFPNVYKGIDFKAANRYLIEQSKPSDRVALCGIPTDIPYTVSTLREPRVVALKMYPAFFIPRAEKIYQYFRPEILEEAQSLNIPIILHLPKLITECVEDLQKLLSDFPRLTVVLAHLGLPHFVVNRLEETYKNFARHEMLFMDNSTITSQEVVKLAISAFGIEKIMFGSDEPINMIRAVAYQNPVLGQRIVTEYLYHWVKVEEHKMFGHLAKGAIHIHLQALLALKGAIEALPASIQDKASHLVFHDTAKQIFRF